MFQEALREDSDSEKKRDVIPYLLTLASKSDIVLKALTQDIEQTCKIIFKFLDTKLYFKLMFIIFYISSIEFAILYCLSIIYLILKHKFLSMGGGNRLPTQAICQLVSYSKKKNTVRPCGKSTRAY